ncbi:segregation/condensation protein A [Haloferax mediterranei ATCC 33500]|uniref:Chromosome segregation protein ScpA n=1 Tax=Haloferax mediterranei (strain ATCC 33500 / DSM 1411 / JCM 8866 / NBRC 14739 / NCIMB 2177 / R-4) TaxID=523841 RepID=I3R2B3_HALMT|nr:segregation/condensation protein A [Haloferax mediterranei]AFK18373.1 smc operon protein [Haloferax mediterranei ATCC 33500]AHZ22231.1 chromosome segregation protein ScpA [Haloferax mediterranei ATCC 33500]EMA02352.1 smc operon protein [Haloferax mediterranei ATCC 33500]MDX5988465.1 segregation/condensation protein A [Haloferax mediterranei ATCC 33500]QCQ74884.1 segregation/condensation protein A [Haloferax mediterranei ATCC 33500]
MTDDIPELNLTRDRGERESSGSNGLAFADDTSATPNGDPDADAPDEDAMDDVLPEDVSETGDDEVEPVELLVQLAKEGTIDPWDIDIVDVTDAFLERLDAMDLRTTGRALFYASVLLRMKSDELLAPDEPDEEELEPWELAMQGGADDGHPGDDGGGPPGFDPIDALEDEMDRRLERKHARGSPETLDELVRELREVERGSWWKRRREYDTSESPRGFSRGTQTLDYHTPGEMRGAGEPTEDDVTGTAHNEDIEAVVDAVRDVVSTHYEKGRDEVLFAEIRDVGDTVMTTYLALLFLAHRSTVFLKQDELFGDLWIRNPEVFDASPDADSSGEVAESEDAPETEDDPELEAEAVADD